jgi:membrane protease YdiL (CAAX protease family)
MSAMLSAILKSGSIASPPRVSLSGSALILSGTAVLCFASLRPDIGGVYLAGVLSLILIAAAITGCHAAVHLSLLGVLIITFAQAGSFFTLWPFHLLAPLLIYAAVVRILPVLRHSTHWMKTGTIDPMIVRLIVAVSLISSIALVGWVTWSNVDMGPYLESMPQLPLWCYPLAGLGFAILNAMMEEAVFRGVAMDALDRALGDGHASVAIQAILFAAFHYQDGFPNGASGFVLTLIYGILLGAMRRLSRGMLAPLTAHIAADLTIFTILLVCYGGAS